MTILTLLSGPRGRRWLAVLRFAIAVSSVLLWSGLALDAQERTVPPAGVQSAVTDARWTPWLGCWKPDDDVEESETEPAPAVVVCVSPADEPAGVVIRAFADQQVVFEETIAADGQRHPPRDPGCQGWQVAEWSSSGRRVFTTAESTCKEQRIVRLSGFTTITPDDRWVDIQTVTSGGRTAMRLRSYRRALGSLPPPLANQAQPPRPRVGPMTFDEVKEASDRLSPFAVEAAIAETRVEFTASAKWVLALADAGVSRRVIDLIVALDFPDRFVVARARPGRPWTRAGLTVSKIEPVVAAVYAPFAYFYWYGDEFWYEPGFIECEPEPPAHVGNHVSQGRLINGLGYTRVEPRAAESASSRSGTSDSSSGSSTDSSGTATSQGYTSGASSGGTHTAQPRPPQ